MTEQDDNVQKNPEPGADEAPAPTEVPPGDGGPKPEPEPTPEPQPEPKPEEETPKADPVKGLMHEESEGEPPKDEESQPSKEEGTLGAPEGSYEVKAPEGSTLDEGTMKAFGEVAKELNLSQSAVQKIVDRVVPALGKQNADAVEKYRAEWAEQSQADEEFGGTKFRENLKGINAAFNRFTTPELRKLFAASGLDSHPEMLRMFYRLNKLTSEGRVIRGGGTQGTPEDDIRNFYKGLK